MASSSQATVLDLLIQKFNGLLPFDLPYPDTDPPIIIDGAPGPNMPENIIAVMPWSGDSSRGRQTWRNTFGGRIEEYSIQVRIRSFIGGGPDPNTASALSTAQGQARANATCMQNAIESSLLCDLTLAAESGVQTIIQFGGGDSDTPPWTVDYSQTNIDDDDGKGRYSEYLMVLNPYNYLSGAG
jgi:hypothetical protein